MRCVGIIARIDASCYRRVALTSPLTEAVWSLDASRSVPKICACFRNKAAFGVAPSLFLAPPAVPSVHSCCWLWPPRRSASAESRSALVCGGRKDAGGFWYTVSPLLPLPVREEEPPLRPDVWRHNHEYSGAVLVWQGKINTREGFW